MGHLFASQTTSRGTTQMEEIFNRKRDELNDRQNKQTNKKRNSKRALVSFTANVNFKEDKASRPTSESQRPTRTTSDGWKPWCFLTAEQISFELRERSICFCNFFYVLSPMPFSRNNFLCYRLVMKAAPPRPLSVGIWCC